MRQVNVDLPLDLVLKGSTASAPAVIVITAPHMANAKDLTANPEPVPAPTSLDEFLAGWTTTVEISEWIRAQTERAAK